VRKAVVLLSGGVDSSTLLTYVGATLGVDERFAITFLYGQKHGREVACARRQAERVGVREHRLLDVEWFAQVASGSALTDESVAVPDLADVAEANRDQPPTYVPNRNMVLLSIGAAYAEARGCDAVYYGAHAGDRYGYWDCTPEFVDRLNAVLALNRRRPVVVHAPFAGRSKADIVRLGRDLGVDYAATWSCYRGGERPCGACPTCVERAEAFRVAGVRDPSASAAGRRVSG
jgi:7-cyano-7-deazaguanine synthase